MAVVSTLRDDLLHLFVGQLRVRFGRMCARRLEQLLVVIGLQVAIAKWAVKLSGHGNAPSMRARRTAADT